MHLNLYIFENYLPRITLGKLIFRTDFTKIMTHRKKSTKSDKNSNISLCVSAYVCVHVCSCVWMGILPIVAHILEVRVQLLHESSPSTLFETRSPVIFHWMSQASWPKSFQGFFCFPFQSCCGELDYRHPPPHLAFTWVLGIRAQAGLRALVASLNHHAITSAQQFLKDITFICSFSYLFTGTYVSQHT